MRLGAEGGTPVVDIHSHVIPGVDDGSPDLETSLSLLRMAAENGTTDIICTPHVLDGGRSLSWETITAKTEELQAEADRYHIPIRLYPGAELEFNADLADLLEAGTGRYCLAGSRYPLIELPALSMPPHIEEFLYDLAVRDFVPVIAHAERHAPLMSEPERLLTWMKRGVLVQTNGGSITGMFGEKVAGHAKRLIENHMTCFIGSDAHRVQGRNTDLTEAVKALRSMAGVGYAEDILENNPRRILENQPLEWDVPDALKEEKKKGFFAKLFG